MNYTKFLKGGMAAVMALAMTACSSGTNTSNATTTTGNAFKLGGSGPISGDAAVYGLAVQHGAEIAVDEINKAGKIQLELNFQDDQADGEQAVNAFNTLVDWGMQVSIATTTSGAGQAVAPLYAQENIFAITPSGSSPAVIYADADNEADAYGNVFQMCFTDPNQGAASADYLAEHTDLGTKIGIIYRSDDNYSNGLYSKFKAQAKKNGLNIVSEQSFTNGATDFSVQVKALQSAGADVVFLPIYYQPAALILAEANAQGYDVNFFGCDGMDGILDMEGFDTSLAEGLYMLTPFAADASDEKTQNFVNTFKTNYGGVPNQFAADAYDAVYAIAAALEASGVTPDADQADITAALVEQFTSMTFDGLTGQDVTWSKTGEVTKAPKAVVIQDGAYVSVE